MVNLQRNQDGRKSPCPTVVMAWPLYHTRKLSNTKHKDTLRHTKQILANEVTWIITKISKYSRFSTTQQHSTTFRNVNHPNEVVHTNLTDNRTRRFESCCLGYYPVDFRCRLNTEFSSVAAVTSALLLAYPSLFSTPLTPFDARAGFLSLHKQVHSGTNKTRPLLILDSSTATNTSRNYPPHVSYLLISSSLFHLTVSKLSTYNCILKK